MQKSIDRVISSALRDTWDIVSYVPCSNPNSSEKASLHYVVLGGSCVVEFKDGCQEGKKYWNEFIPENPSCMRVSHDGKLVAVSSSGPSPDIVILDRDEGIRKGCLEDHASGLGSICFSHDSKFLLSVGTLADGASFVFDMSDCSLKGSTRFSSGFAVSRCCAGGFAKDVKRRPTTSYLFACCGTSTLALVTFCPVTNQLLFLPTSIRAVRDFSSVVFSRNCEILIVATSSGELITVQVKSNSAIGHPVMATGSGGVTTLAVEGDHVFVGCRDGSVSIFRIEDSSLISLRKVSLGEKNVWISSLSVGGSSGQLLVGTSSGSVYVMSLSTCAVDRVNHLPTSGIEQLMVQKKNNDEICSFYSVSNELVNWSLSDEKSSFEILATSNPKNLTFSCGAISPLLSLIGTEDRIYGVDNSRKSIVWDFAVERPTKVELMRSLRSAVVSTAEGELRLYDLRSKEMKLSLKGHAGRVCDLKLFQDESFAISAGKDRNLITYDLSLGRQVTCHRERKSGITACVVCSDQTTVITSGIEKHIIFWDLRVMDPVGVFGLDSAPVVSLSVSEDSITESRSLAAGDSDGHVFLFDLRSMAAREKIAYRHNGAVKSVLLLKNFLVSGGGSDNTISVCNLAASSCKESSFRVAAAPSNTIVPKLDFKNSC